ncbi:putative protease YrrO [Geobacter sp. OR-1]|uniref:peptidase U32 family protein n=1 Tax=Geobacter sp. OR-1 TaxID=1266765 RepID=UPI000543D062|nr:U32 family peptidase [Geobacter sp. OR-1]GAM09765.1 putative protease YrrO [Geobacter sp. OR-1]
MKIPELLAPAGNMEKLKIAVHYGADAVYLGGKSFGLRNLAGNFSVSELAEAADYAHSRGVKVYLTLNAFPANSDFSHLQDYLSEISPIPLDAYIVADPGVIDLVREISPGMELHLSTQANTVNWRSALFWQKQGIRRINLAREMSLAEISETAGRVELELEAFVHGAMCISYSGRCLLSSVMSGRNANKGECSHPCRWGYALVEETRPGEYFPVFEDESGTFIFNSRDLCLIEHLPELAAAGVSSLKIEGRMKGINYVGAVIRVYREALDRLAAEGDAYRFRPEWLEELYKISHRGYTTGFAFGAPLNVGQEYDSRYIRSHEFVGVVESVGEDGTAVIAVRNQIKSGDTIEWLGRGMRLGVMQQVELLDLDSAPLEVANPNSRIRLKPSFPAEQHDLLRKAR